MSEAQTKLLDDVRAKIEESLPAIQVDVFRRYVDEAERAKETLKHTTEELRVITKELKDVKEERNTLRELNLQDENIKGDRATLELDKRKFDIDKQLTEAKLTAETEKRELVRGMFNDVFRNTVVRKNILGDIPVKHKDSTGDEWVGSQPADVDQTETEE